MEEGKGNLRVLNVGVLLYAVGTAEQTVQEGAQCPRKRNKCVCGRGRGRGQGGWGWEGNCIVQSQVRPENSQAGTLPFMPRCAMCSVPFSGRRQISSGNEHLVPDSAYIKAITRTIKLIRFPFLSPADCLWAPLLALVFVLLLTRTLEKGFKLSKIIYLALDGTVELSGLMPGKKM